MVALSCVALPTVGRLTTLICIPDLVLLILTIGLKTTLPRNQHSPVKRHVVVKRLPYSNLMILQLLGILPGIDMFEVRRQRLKVGMKEINHGLNFIYLFALCLALT